MTAPIVFRAGDAFAYTGPASGVGSWAGWSAAASLVRSGAAAASLSIPTTLDAAGVVRLYQPNTAAWPTGDYSLVLRFTSPTGDAISGNAIPVRVTR